MLGVLLSYGGVILALFVSGAIGMFIVMEVLCKLGGAVDMVISCYRSSPFGLGL